MRAKILTGVLVLMVLLATVLVLACGWNAGGGDCYSQYDGCQDDAHQIRAASTASAAAATATAEATDGTNANHQ